MAGQNVNETGEYMSMKRRSSALDKSEPGDIVKRELQDGYIEFEIETTNKSGTPISNDGYLTPATVSGQREETLGEKHQTGGYLFMSPGSSAAQPQRVKFVKSKPKNVVKRELQDGYIEFESSVTQKIETTNKSGNPISADGYLTPATVSNDGYLTPATVSSNLEGPSGDLFMNPGSSVAQPQLLTPATVSRPQEDSSGEEPHYYTIKQTTKNSSENPAICVRKTKFRILADIFVLTLIAAIVTPCVIYYLDLKDKQNTTASPNTTISPTTFSEDSDKQNTTASPNTTISPTTFNEDSENSSREVSSTLPSTMKVTDAPSCIGHQGTEFVAMFLPNWIHSNNNNIELYLTSYEGSPTVQIVSPYPGISTNVTVSNKSKHITINRDIIQIDPQIQSKGLYIKSSSPISVHAFNIYNPGCCTSGGFTWLPIEMLGTNYVAVTYHPGVGSQIGIVAVEDGTQVSVTINTTVSDYVYYNGKTYRNGDLITLLMNRLEATNIESNKDLTWTRIQSNKQIAVISGNKCAAVAHRWNCDHLVEMIPPIDTWGRTYIIPGIKPAKEMIIRIVLSENNTNVEIDNSITTYNTVQIIDVNLNSTIAFVHCSKPCLVVQYAADRSTHDAFMVVIPSTEQYSNHYVFDTPTVKIFTNYISLVIESIYLNGLLYNGRIISGQVTTLTDRNQTQWSNIVIPIGNGTSIISHTSNRVHFGVIQYGFSRREEAYGFPAGLGYKANC